MTRESFDQTEEKNVELAQATGPDLRSEAYSSPGQQVVDWVTALIPGKDSQQSTESQSNNGNPGSTGKESPATRFNRLIADLNPVQAIGKFGQFINEGFNSTDGTLYRHDPRQKANDTGSNLKPGDILREVSNTRDPKLAIYTGQRSDGTPMVTTVIQDSAGKNVVANIPYSQWLSTIKDAGRPNPEIRRPARTDEREARVRDNKRIVTGYRLPELQIG